MNEEQELRARLEAVEMPPSRIEVTGLVGAGRRQAFRRRWTGAIGGMALATTALLAVPAILSGAGANPTAGADVGSGGPATPMAEASRSHSGACPMEELPVPSGMKNVATVAVDPTGRYIVGHNTVGQNFTSILWTDGQPQVLPVPGKSVEASAVNAHGVVVGIVEDTTLQEGHVFRYENGKVTMLDMPSGHWRPYPHPAINAAGDIIVNVEPQGSIEGRNSIVLLWSAGSSTPVKLPVPSGANASANAFAITDDGVIVGGLYKNGVGEAAYAWDRAGHGRLLGVPAGQKGMAYAARGDWATGGMWPAQSVALWNSRTGTMTPLSAPASGKKANGPGMKVNASGWVVTISGAVIRDGVEAPLQVADGQTGRAADLSDTGLVVGGLALTGNATGDQNVGPRIWHC
jgi:probable HAF family extracellular repeat protein